MKKTVMLIVQMLSLVLFTILVVTGKIQLWMGLFAAGLIVSLFFGRIYCGWVCPIHTLMKAETFLKRKLKIKSFKTPAFLKKIWIRYAVLGLFIAMFVLTMVTGISFPVLPSLLAAGVVITIFFPEELWHRWLCPYGTIFSLTASRPHYAMRINNESCVSCGACMRVCPAAAIDNTDSYYMIEARSCLVCMACEEKCGQKSIGYRTKNK